MGVKLLLLALERVSLRKLIDAPRHDTLRRLAEFGVVGTIAAAPSQTAAELWNDLLTAGGNATHSQLPEALRAAGSSVCLVGRWPAWLGDRSVRSTDGTATSNDVDWDGIPRELTQHDQVWFHVGAIDCTPATAAIARRETALAELDTRLASLLGTIDPSTIVVLVSLEAGGALLLAAPDGRWWGRCDMVSAADLGATLWHVAGLEPPVPSQGKVLDLAAERRPPGANAPAAESSGTVSETSATSDEALARERLRGLGYLP